MSDLGDTANWLREQDGTENVETQLSRDDGTRYVTADVQLAGLQLHHLHDQLDVQIRSAWHNPRTDKLRYAIWPESEIEEDA